MASEWEMAAMGVDLGMGMGTYHHAASTPPMSSHHGGAATYSSTAHHHHHHYYGMPPMGDVADATMRMDDLSTGSGAHEFFPAAVTDMAHHSAGAMVGEPSPTANSSDQQTSSLLSFADEFYIPSEEAAELEWLSKFVDDSYSDMSNYSSAAHAAAMAAAAAANAASGNGGGGTSAGQDSCVVTATAPAGRGARSKRSSRATAAAWNSALVPRPPSQSSSPSSPSSSSASGFLPSSSSNKPARPSGGKKQSPAAPPRGGDEVGMEGGVRRCTHCASEKTPQWRSGPLGPKTLCNACGVRFKSGRLVPEYRPAASPTFVLTQHSNSHRKVVELRRQKELTLLRGSHRDAVAASAAAAGGSAAGPRPELMFRDYGGVC